MKVIEKPTEKMRMAMFSAEVGDMANATAVKVHNIPYGDGAFGVYIKGYTKAR
jgi:hypothetical protein